MKRTAHAVTVALFAAVLGFGLAVPAHADEQVAETGTASWYGPELAGNPTASGEIFRPEKLTAAHPTLPLGTKVKVENLENGRSVVVRINDRGPFAGDRVIDLSQKAAQILRMVDAGTAEVRIRPLTEES